MARTTFSGPVASQGGFITQTLTAAELTAPTQAGQFVVVTDQGTNGCLAYSTADGKWINSETGAEIPFGPVPPVTVYQLGVNYSTGGVTGMNQFGANYIVVDAVNWTTPGADLLLAQPDGTVYTFVTGGVSYTLTKTGLSGPSTIVGVFGGPPGLFLYGTTLESITY